MDAAPPPTFLARWCVVLGVLAATPALLYLSGFTVDDALIPARYATNIARGLGYRFNASGASTDGVTPLGWAYLLAPFAKASPLGALAASRAFGMVGWLAAAGALGAAIERTPGTRWRRAALSLVFCSAPLGAWAAAGLETGVVVALSTMAAALPARPGWSLAGAAFAGACAWLRPEMVVFAGVLGAGRALLAQGASRRVVVGVLAMGPWCTVVVVRTAVWGRPAPLAVLSKPSDLAHGLAYVLPAIVLAGAPIVAIAPLAYRSLPIWPKFLTAAGLAHLVVVALAGGDWMPLARLICPALPPLTLVAAHLLGAPPFARAAMVRLVLGCAGEVFVFATRGPVAAGVLSDRLALIEAARDPLARARHVATIDVGWVGVATDAEVIDLAGATDPAIASLPGGHTSKAVSAALLTGRGADACVFQIAAHSGSGSNQMPPFARVTEVRLASDPLFVRLYRRRWLSPATLPIKYEILSLPQRSPTHSEPGDRD